VRRRIPLLLGTAIALAAASPAAAAEVTIGSDESNKDAPLWAPATVTISPGDSVRWNLRSAITPPLPHNVLSTTVAGSNSWSFAAQVADGEGVYTFNTPGRYQFYCQFHSNGTTGMAGTVIVGDPPPPPPPPLSEQPFPNDSALTTGTFETGSLDTTRPRLRSVKTKKSGRRVKVSFRVSEQSVVTVRFTRGGKAVKTKKATVGRSGSVTVAGLKPGRYAVKVRATDVAGNASSVRRGSFRIR
jgi:plastocyanin